MKYLAAALMITTSAMAQLPDAPKSHAHKFFDKENVILFAGDITTRTLDAASTHHFLSNPCGCFHEVDLPNSIATHQATMYAYSLSVSAGLIGLSYIAHKTHHHKIERLIPVADIAYDGELVGHNYSLHAR